MEYYQKSADLEYSLAFTNIGYLYETGEGVEQDYSKAIEYYQKSADLGDKNAPKSIDDIRKRMKIILNKI